MCTHLIRLLGNEALAAWEAAHSGLPVPTHAELVAILHIPGPHCCVGGGHLISLASPALSTASGAVVLINTVKLGRKAGRLQSEPQKTPSPELRSWGWGAPSGDIPKRHLP